MMYIKDTKGFTGIDIVISIIVITIFISLISNLIININFNKAQAKKKTDATYYGISEIEKIKVEGYKSEYDNKGITNKDSISEKDINDDEGNFTGYHQKIEIEDYVLIQNDNTKVPNLVKKITVEISYKFKKTEQKVQYSTYITKE